MNPHDDQQPVIAISMGDPAGIGAEVIVKALDSITRQSNEARFVVHGMNELLTYAADLAGIQPFWSRVSHDVYLRDGIPSGHRVIVVDYEQYSGQTGHLGSAPIGPSKRGGQASLDFLQGALNDVHPAETVPTRAEAIVTAPISKTSWHQAGLKRFPGHTELLADRTRAKEHAMMFVAPQLRTILATTHMPLMDVRNVLTLGRVFRPIDLGHHACRDWLGVPHPRIAVCGLNPHASEGGLFGDEEYRVIEPAIRQAQETGIEVTGPYPADTIFNAAVEGQFDLVVCLYHDQGTIPIKLLARDHAVNLTAGLPIVRTSPDHGTAFDIAGQNRAHPGSMLSALTLAREIAA